MTLDFDAALDLEYERTVEHLSAMAIDAQDFAYLHGDDDPSFAGMAAVLRANATAYALRLGKECVGPDLDEVFQ